MIHKLPNFFKYLVPPADAKGVKPWRWAIFIVVLIVATDTLVGRGALAGYGAYAAQADVKVILELQYAEVIRDLHSQICATRPLRNATLENALEDYQLQYESLHGSRYPLLACA